MEYYCFLGINACDSAIKLIFILIGTKRLLKIKNDMNIEKKYLLYQSFENSQSQISKEKWTFPSMIKFIFNKLIVLLYFSSMIIVICFLFNSDNKNLLPHFITKNTKDLNLNYYIINKIVNCLVNCIAWLISTRLFYKEFRIYRDQTWNGMRIFWILHAIINVIYLIYYCFCEEKDKLDNIMFILFAIICLISIIVFLLAIFHPYDVIIEKKVIDIEKNVNEDPNETRISTDIQDELLFNSDDEFISEEDISFHNLKTITIELNDNEGFNKKKYEIELRIKTQDFKQLYFSVKIQKVKHKRIKLPINVSNFNEIILKYYKNRNVSKDLINLLKQAYNISLTLNPQRNSFTGDKRNTNLLAHLYKEIIKKDYNFLLDFLNFLKIKSNELIQNLSEEYTSIYDKNPLVEKEIERINTIGSIFDNFDDDINSSNINNKIIKKQKTMDESPESEKKINNKTNEFDNTISSDLTHPKKRNLISKEYISFSSFINNVLINKRFITIQIISFEQISQKLNFLLKTSKDKNEIMLQKNIDIIHDVLSDDELSNFIIDYSENINDKNSKEKKTMEKLFNSYLNNLLYYDEKMYKIFNINQLINIDMDKFYNEIINNFFEEKSSNIGLFQDDIRQYLFDIKIKIY